MAQSEGNSEKGKEKQTHTLVRGGTGSLHYGKWGNRGESPEPWRSLTRTVSDCGMELHSFLSFPPPHPHALELTEECQVGRKGKAESGGAGEGA